MKFFARAFVLAGILIALFNGNSYAQKKITKAFLSGRYDYSVDTSFIRVGSQYAYRIIYLQKTTYNAYLKMHAAAAKDGICLNILSGTRSFQDQCYKWGSKWNDPQFAGISNTTTKAAKLLRWWSMPGTSRHHWGTDIDLANITLAYYKTPQGKKMYDWMVKNAAKYGFYQPFCAGRTLGYQEEKWHWSYLPLSKKYLAEYVKQITYADIYGFEGSTAAGPLNVIKNWVLAVNPACK